MEETGTNSIAYETRWFIAAFTRALQESLSSAEPIKLVILRPIYLRFEYCLLIYVYTIQDIFSL